MSVDEVLVDLMREQDFARFCELHRCTSLGT